MLYDHVGACYPQGRREVTAQAWTVPLGGAPGPLRGLPSYPCGTTNRNPLTAGPYYSPPPWRPHLQYSVLYRRMAAPENVLYRRMAVPENLLYRRMATFPNSLKLQRQVMRCELLVVMQSELLMVIRCELLTARRCELLIVMSMFVWLKTDNVVLSDVLT